ncbi:RHS repeat-associated core domain-containing protein [Bacteroides acidifaciens]|uniref:RHS repeat-associated core domain-containing protein n=1 Tax=Bacteroides acidifaciens TaxID=85831 RepID=UPI0020CA651F|nr:RHS repeat-associated core domain-containing protein [Bacteroides acidifaciens]
MACIFLVAGMNLFAQESAYAYAANGNLTKDLNKNVVDIQYNCLNLPSRIELGNGNSVSYLYAANGTKLRTTYVIGNDTTVTDYCGNLIYENGVAKTLLVEGGYVSLSDRKYHFYFQDHQGNVRVVADEDGNVEEVNDYYPFGGLMSTSSRRSVQPYKYNGKELETAGGLNWYDYGARRYDPVLGRWNGVDPSCEKHYSWSPYTYCKNNPVLRVDPDGKDDYRINEAGKLFRTPIKGSTYDRLIYSRNKDISIVVNDKSLLPGMYATQKAHGNTGRGAYNSTANLDDAASVFKFAADYTGVEWKLDVYDDNGVKTAVVATDQMTHGVDNGAEAKEKLSIRGEKVIDIHSHQPGGTKGGAGNDFNLAKPNCKNAVYMRNNKIQTDRKGMLYEYTQKQSQVKSVPILDDNDLLRYIKPN